MNKRKRLLCMALLLLLLLTSCGQTEIPTDSKGNGDANAGTGSKQEVLRLITDVEKIALDDYFDSVCGMSVCGNGFVVAGEKDGDPIIHRFREDATIDEAASIIPDSPGSLLCVGEGLNGGFCALFSSEDGGIVLISYNEQGIKQGILAVPRESDEYLGVMMLADEEGLVWTRWSVTRIRKDGSTVPVKLPSTADVSSIEHLADGTLCILYYEAQESVIATIDPATGALEGSARIESFNTRDWFSISGQFNHPYLHTGQALQQLDREDAQIISSMGWADAGIKPNSLSAVIIQNDDALIALSYEILEEKSTLFLITTKEDRVERKVITVGVMRGHWSKVEAYVDYFNTTNLYYVAQIRYYEEPMQLAADLTSGNSPDVLEMMHVTIPLNDVNFWDMEKLMEQMPLVTPQSFTDNVYHAMQIDGKTLFMLDLFSVETATARKVDVGNKSGWTMDEFEHLMAGKGDGFTAFPAWLSPIEMLHWISFNAMAEYVDYETYTCNFENNAFIRQLELCKNQPDENSEFIRYSDYDEHILLRVESIYNPKWLSTIKRNYGIHDYTFIGFPNNRGENGSFFSRGMRSTKLAIPATSPDPEGAWHFVCGMFDESWQKAEDGLPVMREQMEEALQEALNDESLDFTGEDYAIMMDLLQTTNDFVHEDNNIIKIIEEEAQAFFADAIDGAEAARRIQNRVTLYLEERK